MFGIGTHIIDRDASTAIRWGYLFKINSQLEGKFAHSRGRLYAPLGRRGGWGCR
jgi:hypothetical protein